MRQAWHSLWNILPVGLLFLCSCASGAMRIDVEVYKGPLAQTSDSQFASLVGYLEEAKRSIVENMNFTLAIVANAGFEKLGVKAQRSQGNGCETEYFYSIDVGNFLKPTSRSIDPGQRASDSSPNTPCPQKNDTQVGSPTEKSDGDKQLPKLQLYFPFLLGKGREEYSIDTPISWCDKLDPEGGYDQFAYFDCTILRSIFSDSRDMLREVNDLLAGHIQQAHALGWNIDEPKMRSLLMEVAEMASEFRAKAFRWAVANVGGQSGNCKTRIAQANFVMTASEFGNQLQTQADALLKQLGLESGRDSRELALSTHLQDTEPTDFIHLYDWMEASTDGCPLDWFRRHVLPGYPGINVQDRVKIVERLYGDHFWAKINTVHASGVGKVNIVFVKDGIGNWNLKNFENHPGELLDAYLNVGKKALEAAAKLAAATSGVGSGGAAITAALKYADQTIVGPSSATSGSQVLEDLLSLEVDLRSALSKQSVEAFDKEKPSKGDPIKLKELRLETIAQYEKTLTTFGNKIRVLSKTLQPTPDTKETEETVMKVLKSK